MTIISRGVEISIAGGGGEMVREPISWSFLFLFFVIMRLLFLGTKASCSTRYAENKTYKSKENNKGKSLHRSISTIPKVSPPLGHLPHITRKVQTNNLVVYKGKPK